MERTEITLDFETYYDKKSKYFLKNKNSGLTIEQYIRNPKFEVIGVSVKVGNRPTEWLCPHEIEDWLKHVEVAYGWDNVRLIAHNGRFDCAILGWIYNIYPGQIADTMLMSRACQLWDGNSLDVVTRQLRDTFGWGIVRNDAGETTWGHLSAEEMLCSLDKGDEVINADGKHLMDFTDDEYDAYAEYGRTDVDLTWSAYNWFMREAKFPELEIDVMTATIETFTYPVVELHEPVLKVVRDMVNGKRDALLNKVGATLSDLRSDDKFAELLRNLGVEPPTKLNAKGQTKYAFAKKDLDFLRLLEHEDPNVVELVEARLGNKSSQAVTRVERFFDLASRNPMPMPLEYYAAHTGRWGGCLVGETRIMVESLDGEIYNKRLIDVSNDDLVWDGVEFVSHEGVKFSGYKEVIIYDNIIGTRNHPVFIDENKVVPLEEAQAMKLPIYSLAKIANVPGVDESFFARYENGDIVPVYDIVNCGPRHRFWANGKLVHNSDAVNVQNMNRNQLVDKSTPVGTKVFYKDVADAVVAVLDDNKVHLARAGVVENDEEELHIMGLRDAIKAPKGKKLVVLDWSQIELRFNSWLWGEVWILDTLVSGKDVYKVTAAMTYGIEYDEVNKSQRFVGKSQQLGLGYGAGKNGLIVVMGKRSEEFTEQQLQSFVNAYRQSAPNIKRGWDKCKTMLNAMVQGIDVELGDKNELFYSVGNKVMRPNGMALTYRGVHHRSGEMGNELWFWGKNKQTKKPDWEKTFGGKITENLCVDGDAEVMTDRGWVKLKDVKLTDKVHDGVEFVTHSGILYKSVKQCVNIDGVYMTEDHEVLTNDGWKEAGVLISERSTSSIQRLDRATLREISSGRESKKKQSVVVVIPMRVWQFLCERPRRRKEVDKAREYSKLRMYSKLANQREKSYAWHDEAPSLRNLAFNETALYTTEPQGVAQLRWTWYQGLPSMVGELRELPRRYAPFLQRWVGFRSDRQQRELRTGELSLGISKGELQKSTTYGVDRYEGRNEANRDGIFTKVWDRAYNRIVSLISRSGDASTGGETGCYKEVYDILDCGPRNRFVVKGKEEPFIVHNCQAACRDIAAEKVVNLRKKFFDRGFTRDDAHIVMTVHDEIIVCCKDELAEEVFDIMQDVMTHSTGWYATLPLAVDGSIAQRYGCAK